MRELYGRVPHATAAAVAAGCLLVLAAAFLLGRALAPDAPPAQGLRPVQAASAEVSLPHLSQAVPVPALAAAPAAPAVEPAPVPTVRRSKPKQPGGPVDIVGSG